MSNVRDGLVDSAAKADAPEDRRIYGFALAKVIDNCDGAKSGRVKIRLPWLPGYEPWARVATGSAGPENGLFFIPRKGDEVVVGFNHGDVREPFVVGSVWNARGLPPKEGKDDPEHKRLIRTPMGHRVEFDDQAKTVVITSVDKRRMVLGPDGIEVSLDSQGKTVVTLDRSGNVTIKTGASLTLEGETITIKGKRLNFEGTASATLKGGGQLTLDAGRIDIG